MSFKLRTYNGTISGKHCFFVLNKGNNSGKPLLAPCPNCFVLSANSAQERDFYYWLCYGLWQSNAFHYYLRGSVIPFIVLDEMQKCICEAATKANNNMPAFSKAVTQLNLVQQYEQNLKEQMKKIKELKQSIFYHAMRAAPS